MTVNNQQLIELVDFSPALDFSAKVRWRSYIPYLGSQEREKLYETLSAEKEAITALLKQKLKGVRGYFFAKNLEALEHDLIQKNK